MQDNYALQARQAKACFLSYDQEKLIRTHHLSRDEDFLYLTFFSQPYRIEKCTGDLSFLEDGSWKDGNSHGEVMTILDLLCDSREDRHPAGKLRSMQAFGHQFHQALGEQDPRAFLFQDRPQDLKAACLSLGGTPFFPGDVAFSIPVFEDLALVLQFFQGDEEFAPRLHFLWDENALQYLKYETMYYAVDVLMDKITNRL